MKRTKLLFVPLAAISLVSFLYSFTAKASGVIVGETDSHGSYIDYIAQDQLHNYSMNHYTTVAWEVIYPKQTGGTNKITSYIGSQQQKAYNPVSNLVTTELKAYLPEITDIKAPSKPGTVNVPVTVNSLFYVYKPDGTQIAPYPLHTSEVNSKYGIYTPPDPAQYDNLNTLLSFPFYGGYFAVALDDGTLPPNRPTFLQGSQLKMVGAAGANFSMNIPSTFTDSSGKTYTYTHSVVCNMTNQTSGQVDFSTANSDSTSLTRSTKLAKGTGSEILAYYKLQTPVDTGGGSGSTVTPPPPPPVDQTPDQPPIAVIGAPTIYEAGDDMRIDGSASYDPDGTISNYSWSLPGANNGLNGAMGTVWYPNPGVYNIGLTVTDNSNNTGSTSQSIVITAPTPIAKINITGSLKQNRKVTIASNSYSPAHYPINSTTWAITPVSGKYDVQTMASGIKYVGNLSGNVSNDILFKYPGMYQVSLTVTNTQGKSDTTTQTVSIDPDLPPVAWFTGVQTVYRDPNNNNAATFKLNDTSYSPDGDSIAKRVWKFAYDSNNDGNFTDEQWATIDDSTLTFGQFTTVTIAGETYKVEKDIQNGQYTFVVQTTDPTQVGKFDFELQVTEAFGQPTIQQFITSSDYQTGQTW